MAALEDIVMIDPSSPSGLSWKCDGYRNKYRAGDPALIYRCPKTGYYRGSVEGVRYQAHRVVVYLATGLMPSVVDHLDGNKGNNNPDNLRSVDTSKNQHNREAKGYGLCKQTGKWKAAIRPPFGNTITLGRFSTEEEARVAYVSAKAILHPTAPSRVLEVCHRSL